MRADVHIQTALRDNLTYLKSSFCSQPFKIADITEDRRKPCLHVMLMSSSPGILDGDEFRMKIELAERSALRLETQSYQRLFTMKTSASQEMEIFMANGSSFSYLPHPVVPHEASDFSSRNKIYLSSGCSLTWAEVFTCGRKLNGEVFRFTKYHSLTEIYLQGKLVMKENLFIQPTAIDITQIGQMEGYTHQASLIYLEEKRIMPQLVKELNDWFSSQPGIIFGISAVPLNGIIVRMLGQKAEQLHDCVKKAAGMGLRFKV